MPWGCLCICGFIRAWGNSFFFVVVVFMYLIEVSLTHNVMSVSGVWQSHRSLSSVRRECSQDLEDGFPEGVE